MVHCHGRGREFESRRPRYPFRVQPGDMGNTTYLRRRQCSVVARPGGTITSELPTNLPGATLICVDSRRQVEFADLLRIGLSG